MVSELSAIMLVFLCLQEQLPEHRPASAASLAAPHIAAPSIAEPTMSCHDFMLCLQEQLPEHRPASAASLAAPHIAAPATAEPTQGASSSTAGESLLARLRAAQTSAPGQHASNREQDHSLHEPAAGSQAAAQRTDSRSVAGQLRDSEAQTDVARGASALIMAASKEIQRLRTVNEQLMAAQPAGEQPNPCVCVRA